MYKNNMDHHEKGEYIGLDGKICDNPKYYCKIHLVYLSDKDVERKKCLCKPTFDLIGTTTCRSLITIDKYEKEQIKHKESIKKVNASRVKSGMSSYNRTKDDTVQTI